MAQLDDQATLIRQLQGRVAALEAGVRSGLGSPEGVVAAPVGTLFRRTNGSTSTVLYVKETGGSTSSGWVAK
jgi:hypothetical protein